MGIGLFLPDSGSVFSGKDNKKRKATPKFFGIAFLAFVSDGDARTASHIIFI
jgi:hypothetical protein